MSGHELQQPSLIAYSQPDFWTNGGHGVEDVPSAKALAEQTYAHYVGYISMSASDRLLIHCRPDLASAMLIPITGLYLMQPVSSEIPHQALILNGVIQQHYHANRGASNSFTRAGLRTRNMLRSRI